MVELTEDQICKKLCEWMKEGEAHYDSYPQNSLNKVHPNTLRGYMQVVGWVKRDLRVCLDRANQELLTIRGKLP